MGSISNETRLKQKERALADLKSREATLTEAGVSDKEQAKDPVLRKLKAKVKKANRQLEAIKTRAAHVAKVSQEKAERKKKEKEKLSGKKPKGTKGGEAKKAQNKKKAKKEKKTK